MLALLERIFFFCMWLLRLKSQIRWDLAVVLIFMDQIIQTLGGGEDLGGGLEILWGCDSKVRKVVTISLQVSELKRGVFLDSMLGGREGGWVRGGWEGYSPFYIIVCTKYTHHSV